MANFNFSKVIIGGRLTAEPELQVTQSGVNVISFSIAVNRKGAERKTDFIDCVAWRGTAEFIGKYFRKGSSICIVGSLQKREWTDKNGQKRYATEVIADEVCFVDSKSDNASEIPDINDREPQYEDVTDSDDLPF